MRHPLKRSLSFAATTALLAATMAIPAEASEPKADEPDQRESSQPNTENGDGAEQGEPDHAGARSAQWPGRNCKFHAEAHWPHVSGNDASGHGNWVNTSNPKSRCPKRAYVTVRLQAHGCLQVFPYTCHWHTQASKTRKVRSGVQVPVHVPCGVREPGKWRTKTTVKVPIDGWFDKWDTEISDEKWLNCRPHHLG